MKITIVIPTYNEVDNIESGYERLRKVTDACQEYSWEYLYIDNLSTDGTRAKLRALAVADKNVKVIFNAVNVGWSRSSFYGLMNATGDAAILLSADMQEPPEVIPRFLEQYKKGYRIVIGKKTRSKENPLKYFVRKIYYGILHKMAEIEHIDQFMGFGLYDRQFLDVLRKLEDPIPYLRGMVAELGGERAEIEYTQETRKHGKTHFNFWGMYDLAMLGITSYTKVMMRVCTLIGMVIGTVSTILAIITAFLKIFRIVDYPNGVAAIIVAVMILGSMILFFVGLLGEYVLSINQRVMKRPLVVEETRLNFDIAE